MDIPHNGSGEDLIQRPGDCDYCMFEEVLTEEQRKMKVLNVEVPKSHAHRVSIEYACGRNYSKVCPMKYAAMRAFPNDFTACQYGAIRDFIWDLGKKFSKKVCYNEAIPQWTKNQDLGRGIEESYAERFREIWNLGQRKIEGNNSEMQQNLTSPQIYEIVIASPVVYECALGLHKKLLEEHKERKYNGKKVQ